MAEKLSCILDIFTIISFIPIIYLVVYSLSEYKIINEKFDIIEDTLSELIFILLIFCTLGFSYFLFVKKRKYKNSIIHEYFNMIDFYPTRNK